MSHKLRRPILCSFSGLPAALAFQRVSTTFEGPSLYYLLKKVFLKEKFKLRKPLYALHSLSTSLIFGLVKHCFAVSTMPRYNFLGCWLLQFENSHAVLWPRYKRIIPIWHRKYIGSIKTWRKLRFYFSSTFAEKIICCCHIFATQ